MRGAVPVEEVAAGAGREPLVVAAHADVADVERQEVDEVRGHVDDTLGPVLRRDDGRLRERLPLHLPTDGDRAAQEVDVVELQPRSLAEPEAGERAHGHERPEPGLGNLERVPDLLGAREGHGRGRSAGSGQGDALGGVHRHEPVRDGRA